MWVVTGPFDGELQDELPTPKAKLLKTGCEYIVGRKSQKLLIRHKRISGNHAKFEVGTCTEEEIMNPTFIPALILHVNVRARSIHRPGQEVPITVNNGEQVYLQDGDVVDMVSNIPVHIKWEKVCCYAPPVNGNPAVSATACAALGITLLYTTNVDVTHHLTPTYVLSPVIATSLLSLANFAKPEWLEKILQLGVSDNSSLEQEFVLPLLSKYRPTFSPALPAALKTFKVWEPNEARVGLFRGHRFIFVGEKGREVPEATRELVRRGEGEYECIAIQGGQKALHKILAKGKGKERALVLVADESAMRLAVGEDGWKQLMDEAESFELRFIAHEKIVEAVVYVDLLHLGSEASAVDMSRQSLSSLPDLIPNTHPDEPSLPPEDPPAQAPSVPQRRILPRRATSRASSRAFSPPPSSTPLLLPATNNHEEPREPEVSKPRKALVRRAGRSRTPILGIDDPSLDLDGDVLGAPNSEKTASPELERPLRSRDTVPATPARSSRLKRRVGTTQAPTQIFGLSEDAMVPEAAEPPLKKFKALYEESDPDRIAQLGMTQYSSAMGPTNPSSTGLDQSLTQSESGMTQGRPLPGGVAQLAAVAEEEEESGPSGHSGTQGKSLKRKTQAASDSEDVHMVDETGPRTKRRAIASVNAVEASTSKVGAKPPSKAAGKPSFVGKTQSKMQKSHASASGAAVGKPDTDDAFLKAVASTKRGKKNEDTFDREFNELHISKPELDRNTDQERKEWAVLEDFGDDHDVRGNFMVIVEMPVSDRCEQQALRHAGGRLDWEGRPDFKKFKKKALAGSRKVVELYVDQNDYGMGSQYLKSTALVHSQVKPEADESRASGTQAQTQRKGKGQAKAVAASDDENAESSQTRGTESNPSQKASQPTATQTRRTRSRGKTQPLFITSDDEAQDEPVLQSDDAFDFKSDEGEDEDERIAPQKTRKSSRAASSKAAALVMDDDSDDSATFKGFGANKKGKRR